ncbi:MAG: efflux RND transporter periplasmic adaptor subunit [Planctomycetota bacterium]|jgi:HlyD family secretion protein
MKGFFIFLGLIAISAGVFALGQFRRESDDKPILHVAEEAALEVRVSAPKRGEIVRLAQAPGDVEAVLDVDISSEIVSKIEEMPVEEGDLVKEGQLLCRLDDKQLRADLESGEARIASLNAAIAQAEADLEKAERDCQRQMRLSEANATTMLELADYATIRKKSRALVDMRRHELAQAEAMLRRIQEDLKRTIITSPIDGIVSKRNAKPGEVVITGTMNNPGTVIMTVTDLSRMRVRARVDEVEVPLVKAGQKARVYLQSDPEKPVRARVERVASKGVKQVGRDVVTFEAILDVLEIDERIKPGMTANVEIEVASRDNAVTIPVEAIVHRMRKELDDSIIAKYDSLQETLDISERARQAQYIKVVYVKDGERARVRVIQPGIADSRYVEICEGVGEEEEIIIGPYRSLDQLKDGKKVALAEDEEKKEGAPDDDEEDGAEDEPRSAGASEDEGEKEKDDAGGSDDAPTKTVAAGNQP